jgi:ribosome-binding protein aMBF1 (putative translation factor)
MPVEHQDWNNIVFNKPKQILKTNNTQPKKVSDNEEVKLEVPKQLGQLILQARNANNKNQKELAQNIGVAVQIVSRWESNKEIPNNKQIANIEKVLKTKLPRIKKQVKQVE